MKNKMNRLRDYLLIESIDRLFDLYENGKTDLFAEELFLLNPTYKNFVLEEIERGNIKTRTQRPLYEMARVGFMNAKGYQKTGPGEFSVSVRTNDPGFIPHVHILSKNRETEICVKLESAEYFNHEDHMVEMNNKYAEAFYKFMLYSPDKVFKNNYEYACYEWNRNNSQVQVEVKYDEDGSPIVPNYKDINKRKP